MLRVRNGRRRFILKGLGVCGMAPFSLAFAQASSTFRFGTTPVFLNEHVETTTRWRTYLTEATGMPVQFVQRGSYGEILELLLRDEMDAAWICGYPYVLSKARLALLATPIYHGKPLYQSYVIVPTTDAATRSIADLRSAIYAFSDPLSNSGYLVPKSELLTMGTTPEAHFRKTFFTFSHRKVIDAVRLGVAQGGSVDGYVWDTLARQQPQATEGVRVAWRSAEFGFPPLVVRKTLSRELVAKAHRAFVGMAGSPQGRDVLTRLNLDGFGDAPEETFDSIAVLARRVGGTQA